MTPTRSSTAVRRLRRALEVVRADFSPAVWAAFTRFALDGVPADRVADELRVTANAVYLARNRVLTRVFAPS